MTTPSNTVPLFAPGIVYATPAALETLDIYQVAFPDLLARHLTGDWGVLSEEDALANTMALARGGRLFSVYPLDTRTTVWVITEADRSATTLLLPEEY